MLIFACTAVKEQSRQVKIGIIADGSFADKGFNESALDALNEIREDYGVEIISRESSLDSFLGDIEELNGMGVDLMWLVGQPFADVAETVASENTAIKYAVIDAVYDSSILLPSNLTSMTFRTEESAFLVGYIAARKSRIDRIGFIGGMDVPVINTFRFGYEAGALYAKSDIYVEVDYVGDFNDKGLGKIAAEKMYSNGADVIFTAAGLTGLGVIDVAEKLGDGHYVIGVDQDQSQLAPNSIITSAVKDVRRAVLSFTANYLTTKHFDGGGRTNSYGLREGFVGHIRNPKMIPDEMEAEIEEISQKIINGKIVVPKDYKSFSKFIELRDEVKE
ncbi:BMP family ABC transporter substrate-binding protein (plasmid) [Borrelia turcica IST7]|uniref:BMP family ABC transporter substrate-binding protein n=2 Tax=Borrelia turcica TaxID=229155 RepID=A0A386PQV6_9SPIR|nr:BMP family ABC transporter substrate-binding protein [Borrelia turcica IST7]